MADQQKKSWLKRHKILTVLGILIVLGVIVTATNGGDKSNSSSSNNAQSSDSTSSAKATTAAAKLGEAARDGQFEFVVKSVECGKPSVVDSSGYMTKTAQGQFCLVDLSVKNIGDKQQNFSQSDQKLLNASGTQYSSDLTATLYHNNNADAWGSQINPGNSVEGVLVFDIPKDQAAASAELHDSAFSGGVKVTLQ